jgi:hypothetical protein
MMVETFEIIFFRGGVMKSVGRLRNQPLEKGAM